MGIYVQISVIVTLKIANHLIYFEILQNFVYKYMPGIFICRAAAISMLSMEWRGILLIDKGTDAHASEKTEFLCYLLVAIFF